MTETENAKKLNSGDLALQRTRLASVRTEFALMRTGFSVASFGAGITQLIGRDMWPGWLTDWLTSTFLVVGMVIVQAGLIRFRHNSEKFGVESGENGLSLLLMKLIPWLLQAVLLALLVLVLIY